VMAEEKTWLNYLALTTVIFAVCATLATFKGGGYSTRSVMSQSQASDQWSFYQSKSIKSYIYQMQKETFELKLLELPKSTTDEVINTYKLKIADYQKKIDKYEAEKSEIQEKGKKLEVLRDESQKHTQAFGMATIFLQIAILLSSIAALLKKKPVWLGGIAAGMLGLLYFANGFFMFM
jgi:Domain of unknown function (DUF4337)